MPRKSVRRRRSFKRKAAPYVVAGAVMLGAHAGIKAIENKPILVKPKVINVIGVGAGAFALSRLVKKKGDLRKASIGAGMGVGAVHPIIALATDVAVTKKGREAAWKGTKAVGRGIKGGARWAWRSGREWNENRKNSKANKSAAPPRGRTKPRQRGP